MSTTIRPGVYRAPSGHTITLNKNHPEEAGIPDGYEFVATEADFAKGTFHPYAMPGTPEFDDYDPTAQVHGSGNWTTGPTAPAGDGDGVTEAEAKKLVDAAVKKVETAAATKAKAETEKAIEKALAEQATAFKEQLDAVKANQPTADATQAMIDAAVEAAVKKATE